MNKNNKKCIIVDIDNTIGFDKIKTSIPTEPIREVWDKFHEEHEFYNPNNFIKYDDVVELIINLWSEDLDLVFLTAREQANIKIWSNTVKLIRKYFGGMYNPVLYMRKYNDFRKDYEVKRDILVNDISLKYNPVLVIDDNIDNINMFREMGIPMVLHVNKEIKNG